MTDCKFWYWTGWVLLIAAFICMIGGASLNAMGLASIISFGVYAIIERIDLLMKMRKKGELDEPEKPFYISDNIGGFDGFLVDHNHGEKLSPGIYRVRELGSDRIYWRKFDTPPKE